MNNVIRSQIIKISDKIGIRTGGTSHFRARNIPVFQIMSYPVLRATEDLDLRIDAQE